MNHKEQEFLKRLRATFRLEADEHLKEITQGLLNLEQDADPEGRSNILETVFRAAHSLKGAARSVNLNVFETLCQSVEGVFAAVKRGELSIDMALYSQLHEAVELLYLHLSALDAPTDELIHAITELIRRLEDSVVGVPNTAKTDPEPAEGKPEVRPAAPAGETRSSSPDPVLGAEVIRLPVQQLDSLLRQTEQC